MLIDQRKLWRIDKQLQTYKTTFANNKLKLQVIYELKIRD